MWRRFNILYDFKHSCSHFTVPSEVFAPDGSRFKIIGISDFFMPFIKIDTISFDESTDIAEIPCNFIFKSRVSFILPPTLKRINSCDKSKTNRSVATVNRINRLVSITGERNIKNHFPLEIVFQETRKPNFKIIETTRIIGKSAFYGSKSIRYVVFPPSVELIDNESFHNCSRLRQITIKGISHLKKIGAGAFSETLVSKVSFPGSLEVIGINAFFSCIELKSIKFAEKSKLMITRACAYQGTKLKSIEFLSYIEVIETFAFRLCKFPEYISFQKESNLKRIDMSAFSITKI